LGLLKTLGSTRAESFWSLRAEVVNGRITSLERLRSQVTFYEHTPIRQGHTQDGQLLGSPLLERTGGLELAADHWSRRGRAGILLWQRLMPPVAKEGSSASEARSQWAVELNTTRFLQRGDLSARTGMMFDLNRTAGRDEHSLFLGLSWRHSLDTEQR
jgi:hypothetical protein